MTTTNIEYIFENMRSEGIIYFCILDVKNNYLKDQRSSNYDTEAAINDIKQFMAHNEGMFCVELRERAERGGNFKKYVYNVRNFNQKEAEAPAFNQGINGLMGGMPTGNEFFALLQKREQDLKEAQEKNLMALMEHMRKENELQNQIMRQELTNKNNDGEDKFMKMATIAMAGFFGGGQAMNGAGEGNNQSENVDINDNNQAINLAVVRLMKADKNFAKNITKLASIAESKPAIYEMAISQLNNL